MTLFEPILGLLFGLIVVLNLLRLAIDLERVNKR